MKNILISGGAGYIGSFTTNYFLARGYTITIIDDLSTGHQWAIPANVECVEVNLLDPANLRLKLADKTFDGLIHFAAKSLVGESVSNPELYYTNNIVGSLNLIRAAMEREAKRIIFSSTAAVYGEPCIKLDECHPRNPLNPYGRTKLTVECFLEDFSRSSDLKAIALRYFNACGASADGKRGECHKPETHLIPLAVGAALGIYPDLNIFGSDYPTPDGSAIRDFIHVDDLAAAHLLAYESLESKNGGFFDVFNVGTGSGHSVLEVIHTVQKVLDRKVPHKICARRPGDPAVLVASTDKIKRVLNWSEKYSSLEDIIAGVGKWMEGNRELF